MILLNYRSELTRYFWPQALFPAQAVAFQAMGFDLLHSAMALPTLPLLPRTNSMPGSSGVSTASYVVRPTSAVISVPAVFLLATLEQSGS